MDKESFVLGVKRHAAEGAARAVIRTLSKPPGRKPAQEVVQRSQHFNQLGEADKKFVEEVVQEAVSQAIFSFLCVLDHVAFLENGNGKGRFELYYLAPDGKRTLLNSFEEGEFLHDIFNAL